MRFRFIAGLVPLAAFVLLEPAAALAQQGLGTAIPLNQEAKPKTPEQIEKEKAADDAYKASLKSIPDSKATVDPWGNMRSAGGPAASSATDKSKTAKTAKKPAPPTKLLN